MKTMTKTVRRVDPAWLSVEVGKRIRAERQKQGWSAAELGLQMGVTRAAVSNWELGNQKGFLLQNLYDLALVFGIPVSRLLP